MSTFKHRTKKVHIKDNRITLDARHNNYIKNFKKDKKKLPQLKRLMQIKKAIIIKK